jgi:hypothetical protein
MVISSHLFSLEEMFVPPTPRQFQRNIDQKIVYFCRRIVVIAGFIEKKTVIAKDEFSATHLWIPAPIKFIQLK